MMENKKVNVNNFTDIPFVPSGKDFKFCGSLGLIDLFYRSHNCQFLELANDMIVDTGCFYFWDFWFENFNPVFSYPIRNENGEINQEESDKLEQEKQVFRYGDCVLFDFGKDMDYRYIVGVIVNASSREVLLTIPNSFITLTSSCITTIDKMLQAKELENYFVFSLKEAKKTAYPVDLESKAVKKQIERNKNHIAMKNEVCKYVNAVLQKAIVNNKPFSSRECEMIFNKTSFYWDKLGYGTRDKQKLCKLLQANRLTFNAGFTPFRAFVNDKSKDKKLTFTL